MSRFFPNKKIDIPTNADHLILAIEDLKTKITQKKTLLRIDFEEFNEGSGLTRDVRLPIERSERILLNLNKIKHHIDKGNSDALNQIDVENLIKIARYTAQFLPDEGHYGYYAGRFEEINFTTDVLNYKEAAAAIGLKFGNAYQQLYGDVLKYISGIVLLSLTVATLYLSISLLAPAPLFILAVGIAALGLGIYLAQGNAYFKLKNDVDKTLHSRACDKGIGGDEDPDVSLKAHIGQAIYNRLT